MCNKRHHQVAEIVVGNAARNAAHWAKVDEMKRQEDARAWDGIKQYEKYVEPRWENPDEYRRRMADYGGC